MNDDRAIRYTACGLDNVLLVGLTQQTDHADQDVTSIPNVRKLHKFIAQLLAEKPTGLAPSELRFLRTELGLTQSQLAKLVHKDHQTVGRWERGETPLDPAADTILRMIVLEWADQRQSIEEVSKRAVSGADAWQITIDASDPAHYRKLAA